MLSAPPPVHGAGDGEVTSLPGIDATLAALDLPGSDDVRARLDDLVDDGNAYAPEVLGAMYIDGYGVAKDRCRAVAFYRLAASRGNARANAVIGGSYAKGKCVARDFEAAREHYAIAIAGGDGKARLDLAFLYLEKEWPRRNEWRAFRLAREAHESAPTPSARARIGARLATFYERGHGVETDLDRAEALRRVAAETGDPMSQMLLAWHLGEFQGSRQRRDEVMMWLMLAALQRHVVGPEIFETVLPLVADEDELGAVRYRATVAARARFDLIAADPTSLVARAVAWCTEYRPGSSDCRWRAAVHHLRCGLWLDDDDRWRGLSRTGYYRRCRERAIAEVEVEAADADAP